MEALLLKVEEKKEQRHITKPDTLKGRWGPLEMNNEKNLLVKILIILRRKIKRKKNQWHFTENAVMIQVLRDPKDGMPGACKSVAEIWKNMKTGKRLEG